jgi:putative redox protein
MAKKLIQEGYRVLVYDWRGLGGSEGDFLNTNLTIHAEDFGSVVRWLQESTGITSSRICALGFSLGATLIAMSIRSGLKFAGAVFLSPALRPAISMWPRYNTPEIKKEIRSKEYFLKEQVRLGKSILESLRDTDLVSAFELEVPLLVCHGTADVRIPITVTQEAFNHVLKSAVFFAEFQEASHSFRPKTKYWNTLINLLSLWLRNGALRTLKRSQVYSPRVGAHRQLALRRHIPSKPFQCRKLHLEPIRSLGSDLIGRQQMIQRWTI